MPDPDQEEPEEVVETAFEQGLAAHLRDLDLDSNPYEDGTSDHHDWMTGWYTMEKRMKE